MNIQFVSLAAVLCSSLAHAQTAIGDFETAPLYQLEYPVFKPMHMIDSLVLDVEDGGGFGSKVVLHGDRILVGAPLYYSASKNGSDKSGVVVSYDSQTGELLSLVDSAESGTYSNFGYGMGRVGELAWIGSMSPYRFDLYNIDNGTRAGSLTPNSDIEGFALCSSESSRFACIQFLTNSETRTTVVFDSGTGEELGRFDVNGRHFNLADASTESVVIDDEQLFVQNFVESDSEPGRFHAQVDVYDMNSFEFQYTIRPAVDSGTFGMSIDLNSEYVAIASGFDGAGYIDPTGQYDTRVGTVDLYDRSNGERVWRFTPRDTMRGSYLGRLGATSIAMNERYVAVGSIFQGSVYLISIENPDLVYRMGNEEGHAFTRDDFGVSLAISNDRLYVGAPEHRFEVDYESGQGTVFVYNIGCLADFNNDSQYSFEDIAEFLDLFRDQDERADLDQNGLYNFMDISECLELLSLGCY